MNQNPARGTVPWRHGRIRGARHATLRSIPDPLRNPAGAGHRRSVRGQPGTSASPDRFEPTLRTGEDPISRRRTCARHALALLAILTVTGCSRWQLASSPTPAGLTDEPPQLVRVTLGNGTRLEITDPVARNDSIIGTTLRPVCTLADAMDPTRGCPERPVPIGVEASDVVELELRRRSVMRSTVLITGLLAGAYQMVRVSVRVFGA